MDRAAIESLSSERQAEVAHLWQMRAASESSVRGVFTQLVADFVAINAHPEVIALARRAMDDEARHARICAELAAAYRNDAPIEATPPPVRLPDYAVPARMRVALHAVNLCCIGETIATAFVEACIAACAWPELREIHGRHLADEIRHAQIGWAHLGTLGVEERAEVATWIPALLRAQVEQWEARLGELPEAGVEGHGYPPRALLIAVVHGAVRDLVLPGFEYLGVSTTAARAWLDARPS
jgi:hypothetical protein